MAYIYGPRNPNLAPILAVAIGFCFSVETPMYAYIHKFLSVSHPECSKKITFALVRVLSPGRGNTKQHCTQKITRNTTDANMYTPALYDVGQVEYGSTRVHINSIAHTPKFYDNRGVGTESRQSNAWNGIGSSERDLRSVQTQLVLEIV